MKSLLTNGGRRLSSGLRTARDEGQRCLEKRHLQELKLPRKALFVTAQIDSKYYILDWSRNAEAQRDPHFIASCRCRARASHDHQLEGTRAGKRVMCEAPIFSSRLLRERPSPFCTSHCDSYLNQHDEHRKTIGDCNEPPGLR
jgi:hypothetical protein